jgi:hypothetical protein
MDATVRMLRSKADQILQEEKFSAENVAQMLSVAADLVMRSKAALTTARVDAMEELSQHFENMATNCLPGQEWVGIVLLNNAAVARALAEVETYGHPGDAGC